MSHLGIYQTHIFNAHPDIARKALELLAAEFQGKIVDEYTNRFGVRVGGNIGVIAEIADGFGIHITEKGRIEVRGDNYGDKIQFDAAHARFVQLYQAVAINHALEKMGYKTETLLQERIVLVGEKN